MLKKSLLAFAAIFIFTVFAFGQSGSTNNSIARVNSTINGIDQTATQTKQLFRKVFGKKQKTTPQPNTTVQVQPSVEEKPPATRPRIVKQL